METTRELASVRLGENLHKIVKVALITYNKQTPFYRKCNTRSMHIQKVVEQFFQGFYREVQLEQLSLESVKSTKEHSFFALQVV